MALAVVALVVAIGLALWSQSRLSIEKFGFSFWTNSVWDPVSGEFGARPFIWGKFIWNMFDFASDGRNEGDGPGRNDKGLVTYDRLTKKDAFYWYKANWSSEPLAHITSRRFTVRNTETVDVKVYSNLAMATLSVNGAPFGEPQTVTDHRAIWTAVPLAVGDNRVEVVASDSAGQSSSDSVTWTRQ